MAFGKTHNYTLECGKCSNTFHTVYIYVYALTTRTYGYNICSLALVYFCVYSPNNTYCAWQKKKYIPEGISIYICQSQIAYSDVFVFPVYGRRATMLKI